jgi:hypothetical protein
MPELSSNQAIEPECCTFCGEETLQVARTVDDSYRGIYHYCRNGECDFCDTAVAVTPPTLCDHSETKRTPSAPNQISYPYCSNCGRLKRDWGKGYESTVAPWDQY